MDLNDLYSDLIYFGSSGFILSQQQLSAILASLTILQNNMKLDSVNLWGKILGLAGDYFIAEGCGDDEFGKKTYFYSKDCSHWKLLNSASDDVRAKSLIVKGRFIGDPSSERDNKYGQTAQIEQENKKSPQAEFVIKEEDRLAGVIAEINHDVRIVPRGAYLVSEKGNVFPNRMFEGLSRAEAVKLSNYMHLRKPEMLDARKLLLNANIDPSVDFMDSIDLDLPPDLIIALFLITGIYTTYVFLPGHAAMLLHYISVAGGRSDQQTGSMSERIQKFGVA